MQSRSLMQDVLNHVQPQTVILQLQNMHRSHDFIQLCLLVIGGRISVSCFNNLTYTSIYIFKYCFNPLHFYDVL